jgi:hypothetical protein
MIRPNESSQARRARTRVRRILVLTGSGVAFVAFLSACIFIYWHFRTTSETATRHGLNIIDLSNDPGSTFKVKYNPNTRIVPQSSARSVVRAVNKDRRTFALDASNPQLQDLKPGNVILLSGIAVRKVTAVKAATHTLIVSTTQAKLTDAITDGIIKWKYPIQFWKLAVARRDASATDRREAASSISRTWLRPVFASEPQSELGSVTETGEENGCEWMEERLVYKS